MIPITHSPASALVIFDLSSEHQGVTGGHGSWHLKDGHELGHYAGYIVSDVQRCSIITMNNRFKMHTETVCKYFLLKEPVIYLVNKMVLKLIVSTSLESMSPPTVTSPRPPPLM